MNSLMSRTIIRNWKLHATRAPPAAGWYHPVISSSKVIPNPSGNCASRNGLRMVLRGSSFRSARVSV